MALICFDLYNEEELQVALQQWSQTQDQNSLLKIFPSVQPVLLLLLLDLMCFIAGKSVILNLCLTWQVVVEAVAVPSADVDVTPPTLLAVSPTA